MIKRISYLLVLLGVLLGPSMAMASEIWVSPRGNDRNVGTKAAPLASLDAAIRKARELRRLKDSELNKGIYIRIEDGTYVLDQPLYLRPEDSGTAESPTWILAAEGAHPVVSGGRRIQTKWAKVGKAPSDLPVKSRGQVWVTDAPVMGDEVLDFRQLWINGVKGVRAKNTPGDSMNRILSWNHEDQTCWIPMPEETNFQWKPGMEFFIHQWWAVATLRVQAVRMAKDSVQLSFLQPESKIQSEHPWPAPWISKKTGNSGFYLTNALQFLDEPGEWFLDKVARKLYYWPRSGERLEEAEVIVPYLETLFHMEGSLDKPIQHIHIKGISWQYSTWLRPSKEGHVPLQAGMYLLDAYKLKVPGTPEKKGLENQAWVGRPASALTVSYAQHTSFEDCRFEHLASTGLDYHRGVQFNQILGNVFQDIGGSAILLGVFSDESMEAHLPYAPSDQREVADSNRIENNLIREVTNEDWGCVGIGAGFVRNTSIQHNQINEISYTGINVGWGWTPIVNTMSNNHIKANKIFHYAKHMNDVAGIYTLSAQPGTLIEENMVDSIYAAPYAHLPEHWFYLYADEGSAYMTVKNNWCPKEKFLQNANGPNNVWENNGPQVKEDIKQRAGLEPAYRHLLNQYKIN